jgi:hypothetical protein
MPINQEELAICSRRRHVGRIEENDWNQCKACGMWVRKILKLEEREDTPPENEWSTGTRLQAMHNKIEAVREEGRFRKFFSGKLFN